MHQPHGLCHALWTPRLRPPWWRITSWSHAACKPGAPSAVWKNLLRPLWRHPVQRKRHMSLAEAASRNRVFFCTSTSTNIDANQWFQQNTFLSINKSHFRALAFSSYMAESELPSSSSTCRSPFGCCPRHGRQRMAFCSPRPSWSLGLGGSALLDRVDYHLVDKSG